MKRILALTALFLAWSAQAKVKGSKHDFSVTGPGEFRAERERDACIFCHISHHSGEIVLSNRPDPFANHRPYESSTISTAPGAPTGTSRICLSCHDGTIAVGQTRNGRIRMIKGNQPIGPERKANLGTDLRRSHPISMVTAQSKKVRKPVRGDPVSLDASGMVQCTSCHDPHDEWRDPVIGKFLVKPSSRSALCSSCHAPASAAAATHLSSAVRQADAEGRERPMVEAGCGACHVQHAADVRGRLLKEVASDDDVCLRCHGTGGQKPVAAQLTKASAHASSGHRTHDASEGPRAAETRRLPEVSVGAARHVTCVDCHDPHASNPSPALAPAAGGALAGVWGIDLNGEKIDPARYEYEVCLKCHGDSANKPQASGRSDAVRRAQDDLNLRQTFAPGAASFHPVAAVGRNAAIPGLVPPLGPTSRILCTDCHASDDGPGAGGTGPRGPHGSIHPFMLERAYETRDFTPESRAAYALCYKCHDRDVLLSSASGFPHQEHVAGQSTPCSACHDAHGVSREAGNERSNAHLVSFDLTIVRPNRGQPRYDATGARTGSCTLTCHDVKHGPGEKAFSY
ncbi:MAG TPA: cytochrome c3 family protein [Anaeromyxobacter sp.]|nr:cytochrome c3 family protein [Anaeromyxobacter sp.]